MERPEDPADPAFDGGSLKILIAANGRYLAYADQHGVFSRDLDHPDPPRRLAGLDDSNAPGKRILLLSPCASHLLAVSKGNQTLIYNLETCALQHVVPGVGRIVTSIAWAPQDPHTIAVGVLDGSICIWSLNGLERPVYRLMTDSRIVCHDLAFCPVQDAVLASRHGGTLAVWSLRSPLRPVLTLQLDSDKYVRCLRWNPDYPGRLLCFSGKRHLTIWDIPQTLNGEPQRNGDSESEDEEIVGRLDTLPSVSPFKLYSAQDLLEIDWLGERGIVGLSKDGHEIVLFSTDGQAGALDRLWRCGLEKSARTIVTRQTTRSVAVVAASRKRSDVYVLPNSLCNDLGRHRQPPRALSVSSYNSIASAKRPESSLLSEERPPLPQSMYPIPVSWHVKEKRAFPKILKQLQHSRRQQPGPRKKNASKRLSAARSATSAKSKHMTDSLELPKRQDQAEQQSPMPFLSPNVPAQKEEHLITGFFSLEDSNPRRTHSASSLENMQSLATQGSHDSDSDDETFGGGLRGSGAFMPGGVNVPLPRACGAFFAPSGQLLTFFPPKVRPPLNRHDEGDMEPQDQKGQQRVARLFPSFGNLKTMTRIHNESDSEGSDIFELGATLHNPKFVIHPSSFPSQQSYNANFSPIKSGAISFTKQHTIVVQVRDVESLFPIRHSAAIGSRVLCDEGETGSDLCHHNAALAERSGLDEAAAVWYLLALLLEDVVPLEEFASNSETVDLMTVARRASALTRSGSTLDKRTRGKLRWADHPLGAPWLAERLIEWAEQRADLYMLAYMSAIMAHDDGLASTRAPHHHAHTMRLAADGHHYSLVTAEMPKPSTPQLPELLRKNSQAVSFDDSPTKHTQGSRTSSRNVSQPTTPYLESNGGTPPFAFPAVSRQGSKLSFSGSASPEYHRSSFSAAAKHYAQSITDRFSIYGSSPPLKKLGTSPSSVELSSSLPTASGSWSKSVSFASTAEVPRETSQLSRSYTGQDDGYDSDKTIEDGSMPNTPRHGQGDIYVDFKNDEFYTDDVTGRVQSRLLSPILAAKAILWQQAFAEQLRVWGMMIQATELEKVTGLTSTPALSDGEQSTMALSQTARRRKPSCGICFCVIEGLEQVCPACLHTTHLTCLEDYLQVVGEDQYRCTTGCGCSCADLSFDMMEWAVSAPVRAVRKASLTDPRRWRARVQGDSW